MSALRFQPTPIEGCITIHGPSYQDHRGIFQELYKAEPFIDANIPWFLQTNLSRSHGNVLRGMHLQKNNPQGKLVHCITGRVWDVCVDVRPRSKTFGAWASFVLDGQQSVYLPAGTAHGFYSFTDSILLYQCTTMFDQPSDTGIRWDDKDLGIAWPCKDPILSEKDSNLPTLKEYLQLEKR